MKNLAAIGVFGMALAGAAAAASGGCTSEFQTCEAKRTCPKPQGGGAGEGGENDGAGRGGTGISGTAGTGRGGSGSGCPSGQHNCSGECVDDASVDHCGGRCEPCPESESGTAICMNGECGIDCGALTLCGNRCIDGCCSDSDCQDQDDRQGQCDTSDNTCRYDCASGFKPCGSSKCIPEDECCSESDCPGSCKTCSDGECVNVTSDDDDDSCAGTCDSNGVCKSRRGQTCTTTPNGCISGSVCAPDGYCCDTACEEPCNACDISGLEGTCTAVASGSPHGNRTPCSDGSVCGGRCTGRNDGQCTYPEGNCGDGPHCSGTEFVDQSHCSDGLCVAPAPTECADGFSCVGSACKTLCTSDTDCLSTHFCEGGTCHLDATAVAADSWNSYALLRNGTVWAWGDNRSGALGPQGPQNGSPDDISNIPVQVTGLGSATAIAAGAYHACALLENGEVWCWGSGFFGQLGGGPVPGDGIQREPVKVQGLPSEPVTEIAAGGSNSCALIGSTGQVYCWGDNDKNQLGEGVTAGTSNTAERIVGIGSASAVRTGMRTCVQVSNSMSCWGYNFYAEIEMPGGSEDPVVTPTAVSIASGSLQQMDLGDGHSCALVSGNVYCWGRNSSGRLGNSTVPENTNSFPVAVAGLSASATQVACGHARTCALLTTGKVRCWGLRSDGALGDGQFEGSSSTPVEVAGLSGVISIAYGGSHGCALVANGSVKCWGYGVTGQLGNGASASSATVVDVKGW